MKSLRAAVGTEDIFETEGQGIGGKAPRGARQAPPPVAFVLGGPAPSTV